MLEKVKKRPGRTKKTRKKDRNPSRMEKWHMGRLKRLPCLVPDCGQPSQVHHERRGDEIRDHQKTVPLCFDHHSAQGFVSSRHSVGRDKFNLIYGLDLEAEAARLWDESVGMRDG